MSTEPAEPQSSAKRRGIIVPSVVAAVIGAGAALGVSALVDQDQSRTVTTIVQQRTSDAAAAEATTTSGTTPSTAAVDGSAIGTDVSTIVDAVSPGVTTVRTTTSGSSGSFGGSGSGEALGTGFLIDKDGHILTNAHVVKDGTDITVGFKDGTVEDAKLVGIDESLDIAVLKIADVPKTATVVEMGSIRNLEVGDPLVAIGNPLGFEQTVTTGIVSALKRYISSPNDATISNVIQTDAAINQGNSGGPLLDLQGRVVGINSQIATENGGNVGIGFAVPIDLIKPTVASIIADGTAEHAWIGIKGTQLTPRVATANGLGDQRGVMVVSLDSRGPARKAGLEGATSGTSDNPDAIPKGGDVIVAVDGTAVQDMGDVSLDIASKAVGDEVTITVLRDGARKEFTVKLADRPADIK
ncbi:MAG: trypsin-like peptidase domain-containing protein [Actinobacteria bacterium]|nr:trypsin-like peptidase domain-containing protein [Actinomycetota bacterium]